ncbi:tricarballylate utilization 4Fe-4S protein TcuB [Aestuariibius sp. 2305UL40-4]|uniref:tricarballylate utilization 4Fe-4S protein TcuB n=1 Tax=Aestuariibius violaceus TaxID=3234132 RepID=UPI00345EFC35
MNAPNLAELATSSQSEVARQMSICNACRYCEGLCAVFPAMELRRVFSGGDTDYLANLCHNCGACYYDCQYAPPHDFKVDVPNAMARLREETYERYAWPAFARPLFQRNGLWVALALAVSVALFLIGFVVASDPASLFAAGTEPGAFYRIMPHNAMVALFGSVFLFGLFAIFMSLRSFWMASATGPVTLRGLWEATRAAATMRYLDGGGMGCMNESEKPTDRRRLWHHFTFYGFLLCFASTSTGTLFHYGLDWQAPYPWWTPVKVFGVLGGIGIVVGPIGLMMSRKQRDPELRESTTGLGAAFLWMLLLLGVTGLILTGLRHTSAMGLLLAIHLGVVFAFFATMPYGKFMHGFYRFLALVKYAHETGLSHGAEKSGDAAAQRG